MVFISHMIKGWRSELGWIPGPLLKVLDHGWLGVDLFFLLSGFLITGILVDQRGQERYFTRFYARRSLRILPLYFTCVALMYFGYPGYGSFFLVSLVFLQNFVHDLGIPTPHGGEVFWSLAVEEHFYLIWPWLVRFCSNGTVAVVGLGLLVGIPVLRGYCTAQGWNIDSQIYMYSWFRFDSLSLGALLALWYRSRWFSQPGGMRLAGVLLGALAVMTVVGYPFGILRPQTVASGALRYSQAGLLFAVLMVLALSYAGTGWTAVLRHPWAQFSAGLSYCIYLIHLMCGDAYYWVLERMGVDDIALLGGPGAFFTRFAVLMVSSIGLAWLSQRYLEEPFLRLKRYF